MPVPEWRLFQEFYFYQKLNDKARLTHRFRTEQRWFHDYKTDVLTERYNFKFRLRYMLRFDYKLSEKWVFKLSDELMYHTDDFDQNRLFDDFIYQFTKESNIQFGYMNIF